MAQTPMTSLAEHLQKSKEVPPTTVLLRIRKKRSILYFPRGFSLVAPVQRDWIEQMSGLDSEDFPRHHPSTRVPPEFIFPWIVAGVKPHF